MILLSLTVAGWGASISSLAVTATVLSKSNCRFKSTPVPLDFKNLDPTNPAHPPVSATTTIDYQCGGSAALATFSISSNNGLYPSGGKRRMRHPTDPVYIPYDLTLIPQSTQAERSVKQTLTIQGDIAGADYQFATATTSGTSYVDTVILSIIP